MPSGRLSVPSGRLSVPSALDTFFGALRASFGALWASFGTEVERIAVLQLFYSCFIVPWGDTRTRRE